MPSLVVLGVPIGISYVETESMSPTITPGEGFVLIPTAVTGPSEPCDIVVFDAQELGGSGLTTRRIVEKTERGHITKDDNNDIPDQVGSEPPIRQAQITGQVLTVGGRVLTIPHTGMVAMSVDNSDSTSTCSYKG